MMQVIMALTCILSAMAVQEFHAPKTDADRLSWSYSEADIGLNGACSEGYKCGPSMWKAVSLEFKN
jgi:hypothetical protein